MMTAQVTLQELEIGTFSLRLDPAKSGATGKLPVAPFC